jgi:hypothetical protein
MLPHSAPDRWLGSHSGEMRPLGIRFYPKPLAATRRAGKSLLEPTRIPMGLGEGQLQFAHVINNEAGLAAQHRVPFVFTGQVASYLSSLANTTRTLTVDR